MKIDDEKSFLDDALRFASLETRHWIADALACHLHNEGYALQGNTEASDIEWFARQLWERDTGGYGTSWDHRAEEETKVAWRKVAVAVIAALPAYQLRVAHRLIALSKIVRDIESALRAEKAHVASKVKV